VFDLADLLITGAVGQVGRFLIRKLFSKNINFSGIDITTEKNLSPFELLRADITKKIELEKIKHKLLHYKTVVHLASTTNSYQDVTKYGIASIDLNIHGTLNLLEYLPNLEHFCYASSYMVYGIPFSNPISEEHQTNPLNIYGTSKLITEKFLQVFAFKRKIKLGILRFMGIYGLEKPYAIQAIPTFIKLMANNQKPTLYGNGLTRRNHIYINDAVSAILCWLSNKKNGIFNIGGPDAPTNVELVNLINEIMGKNIQPIFKKSENIEYDFISDFSLARKELQFDPLTRIKDGLSKTAQNYLKKNEY